MVRPALGDLELEQVQLVETDEDQVVVRHRVPALEGDFLQDLGRRGARLTLTGVLTAPETRDSLEKVREKFHAGDPVDFVSDMSTATLVEKVLVERMDVREVAGRPSAFEYLLTLRELTEAAPVDTEDVIIPPPPPPTVTDAKLSVTVVVEGEPSFDMDRVRVRVRGPQDDGTLLDRALTTRVRPDTWFEDPFPPGQFTAEARVDDSANPAGRHEVLTGSEQVRVVEGATASVTIVLRRGGTTGTVFVITFHFDKAFVEPCERHVLAQVIEYSAAHPDERLLIVGHTDRAGGDDYNQALSERRARATFAMMTFGSAPARAVAEWDELRRPRPFGTIATVKDTWGRREYQHMLQDLGRFRGNVDADPELTDAAVRQFQSDHGLVPDGVVGDATWPVLIEEYLAHDALDLPVDRLMPNADGTGCDSGPLRWIGCGEQDPVDARQTAWRPNRRTELMFVKESAMPAQVPRPVTLGLDPDLPAETGWCLDDGTATGVDDFVVPWPDPCPVPPQPRWCRVPAEEGTVEVVGRLRFEDGSPFADRPYVLMAGDGEYLNGEVPATTGSTHAGEPKRGRTGPDGSFTFPVPPDPPGTPGAPRFKGPGLYVVFVDGPFLVRRVDQALADVRGNATCFRYDGDPVEIVVVDRAVASVVPSITAPAFVVVRKPHTTPARRPVVLRASEAFTGSGRLERSSDLVRFFDAVTGGAELTFDGVDNVFTDAQLVAGVTLFAEGRAASAAPDDVVLTLALTVGGTPGLTATHRMTAVELFLDLHESRRTTGADPAPLSEAAKVDTGRFVQVQDTGNHAGRAMLTVRQVVPAAFAGTLVLTPLDARTRLFAAADEVAAAGQVAVPTPVRLATATVPAAGARFWVEGAAVSGALRDALLQLGIDGAGTVEPDGDRVHLTVVELSNLTLTIPGTAPNTARLGNDPTPAHVVPGNAVPVAADFDENPRVNVALPLLEGSVVAADPIVATVAVRPAGVPVRWGAQRARGIPAADGGDDAAAIVALHAADAPTVVEDGGNVLRATVLTDNVGTFHVRAFVDGNGTGVYEHGVDREPNIVRNVVIGRVTLFLDSSSPARVPFAATPRADRGIVVDTGDFDITRPGDAAIHLIAQADLVTGGADGRRSVAQFHAGWINNETAPEGIAGTFVDDTGGAPVVRTDVSVVASNRDLASGGAPGDRIFLPGDVAPAIIVPPILDSGFGVAVVGRGARNATLSRNGIRVRTALAVGERWIVDDVDSPSDSEPGRHPAVAAATLRRFRWGLDFTASLSIWTNRSGVPALTGDPVERLYTVLVRTHWQQRGEWTIDPATGAITVVSAPATTIVSTDVTSPAAAVPRPVEVRFPAVLHNLARDARA